ncbi:MAG: hypothetical protein NC177_12270 [Ruminococcus flavefaciens]|nr:hypothetical protein [Ruminococcus flavefaciens]
MIKIFDFIEYTEEIFAGVKNTVGGKTKSGYYLIDSQALSVYVKNCRQSPNHSFTSACISGFLNKCRYFIYPENRTESYKADIPLREFSERCVDMFFKKFGINFSFLRIDSDNTMFVEVQKKCLENLFEQIISLFCKYGSFDEKEFLHFLEMYFCRYRFELYNTDMNCLFSNYDVFTQSELSDYVICTTNAFYKLKFIYTRSNYVVGREEYIRKIRNHYQVQMNEIQSTFRLVYDAVKLGRSIDKNFNIYDLSAVATYMLYKNNYDEVLKKFGKFCSGMADLRKKYSERYDKIMNMNLVKFECTLHKFFFYIIVQYQNAPEDDT